jgi:hypothetical protein
MILSNKEVLYFTEVFLYEKDTMNITLENENIAIEYLKRK